MIPVFVYGTLKYGYGNHILLKDSEYVDDAILEGYNMKYSHGVSGFPVIFKSTSDHISFGEVYMVDDETLSNMDELESNGIMYNRKNVFVILSTGLKLKVQTYVGNANFWNKYKNLESVGKKHHNWQK